MDSDDGFAARILKRDDNLRHAGKLVATCETAYALLISATWRGKAETMMGVPIAEITQSPVRGERFAELPEIIDIEAEMRVVPLRIRPGLCRKQDRRNVMPAPEKISTRFYRPCGRLCCNRAQLGFPGHEPVSYTHLWPGSGRCDSWARRSG